MHRALVAGIAACIIGCASAPPQPRPTLALGQAERHDLLGDVVSNLQVSSELREQGLRPELADRAIDAQIEAMLALGRTRARGELPETVPGAHDRLERMAAIATWLGPYLDLDTGLRDLSRVGFEALASKLGADAEYEAKAPEREDRAPLGRELVDGIAVLAPEYLDAEVADRMTSALEQWADGSAKPRALVLDLSHCSGGSADAATELFNELAPGKIAFKLATRASAKEGLLHRELEGKRGWGTDVYTAAPLFVVTSAKTDGVCEAVAAGLRAQRGAEIIGGATSGRGRIMAYYDLPDGGVFGFAIAELFTVDGAPLSGSPVLPDVCLSSEQALARLAPRDAPTYGLRCKAVQELHPATVLEHIRASLPPPSTEPQPIPPLEHGHPKT